MDKILDKKLDKNFWKLLEVGGAGGTPLAVTQEDCLVLSVFKRENLDFICTTIISAVS